MKLTRNFNFDRDNWWNIRARNAKLRLTVNISTHYVWNILYESIITNMATSLTSIISNKCFTYLLLSAQQLQLQYAIELRHKSAKTVYHETAGVEHITCTLLQICLRWNNWFVLKPQHNTSPRLARELHYIFKHTTSSASDVCKSQYSDEKFWLLLSRTFSALSAWIIC